MRSFLHFRLVHTVQARSTSKWSSFSRSHTHDSVIPNAQFNPFQGGIQFPSSGQTSTRTGILAKKSVGSTSPARKNTARGASLSLMLAPPKVDPPSQVAEDLLKYDDAVGRKEREATARLAVRKLMSLHFHANRTARAEATLEQQESQSIASRYLAERQTQKEANATASFISGAMPIPSQSGTISVASSYASVAQARLRKADEIQRRRAKQADGGLRLKGSFVATPENTADLLREKQKDVHEADWTDLGRGGRSMEDILGLNSVVSTSADEEWADANDSTFLSPNEVLPPQDANDDEVESSGARLLDPCASGPPRGGRASPRRPSQKKEPAPRGRPKRSER